MTLPLTFGSLFAGIGGIDLGLERAGMVCRWQVEIDDYCRRVLTKHWPDVPKYTDIRDVGEELERVDLIAGGFPCQDISFAGKGAGIHGERSGLFFEAICLVRLIQPRFVLLENVAALLSRGMDEVLGTLASVGYDAEWHCIPAAALGAPHIRDRVFIVAYRNANCIDDSSLESVFERPYTEPSGAGKVLADATSNGRQQGKQNDRGRQKGNGSRQKHRFGYVGADRACSDTDSTGPQRRPQGDVSGDETDTKQPRLPIERHDSWWAVEPGVGRVAHGVSNRVDRLRGLGNAVVPQVAEYIGRDIVLKYHEPSSRKNASRMD